MQGKPSEDAVFNDARISHSVIIIVLGGEMTHISISIDPADRVSKQNNPPGLRRREWPRQIEFNDRVLIAPRSSPMSIKTRSCQAVASCECTSGVSYRLQCYLMSLSRIFAS